MSRLLPALLLLVAATVGVLFLILQPQEETPEPIDTGMVPAEVEAADELGKDALMQPATLEEASGLSRTHLEEEEEAGNSEAAALDQAWVLARLVDTSGKAIAGNVLRARKDQPFGIGEALGEATSGAQGSVRLAVPAGRPIALTSSGDYWAAQSFRLAALAPGEELDLGDLTLSPADLLRGRVLDPSGRPVAQAHVRLRESGSSMLASSSVHLSAATDDDGRFEIGGIPTGVYRLSGSGEGFAPAFRDPVVVSGSGKALEEDLQLGIGFEVSGVVLDADDRPIEGVLVSPQRSLWETDFELMDFGNPGDEEPGSRTAAPRGVRTDGQGRFTLRGLEEEVDLLMARGEGYATRRFAVPEEGRQAVVHLTRSLTMAGRVLGPDGKPVAGAEISLSQRSTFEAEFLDPWRPSSRTTSETDGSFALPDLGAGEYRVTALSTLGQLLEMPVTLDQDLTDLTLRLEPARHLVVLVTDLEGHPVVEADVRVREAGRQHDFGNFEIEVDHGSNGPGEDRSGVRMSSLGGAFQATTDAFGRAVVFGVPEGDYEAHVKAKGFADQVHPFERLDDAQEEAVTLTPASELVVHAQAPDGKALEGVEIYLKPLDEEGEVDSQVSDTTGRAVWPRLEQGRYEVGYREAEAQRSGMVFMGVGGPKEKALHPVHELSLEGGSTLAVVVEVRDLALPEVEVTRAGAPAGGISVWLEKAAQGSQPGGMDFGRPSGTQTDAFGHAQLPPQEPGKYTLVARAGRSAPQVRQDVELVAGTQEFKVEIPGAEVTGSLFADGAPMVGATLTLSRDSGGEEEGPRMRGLAIMVVDDGNGPAVELASGNPNDATAVSDGDGDYLFRNVPPGQWVVECRARGYERWTSDPFSVGEGGTVDLGTHRLMQGASLSGADLGYEPSADGGMMGMGSIVQLRDAEGDIVDVSLVGPEGRYRFGDLQAGSYSVQLGSYTSEPIEIQAGEQKEHDLPKE